MQDIKEIEKILWFTETDEIKVCTTVEKDDFKQIIYNVKQNKSKEIKIENSSTFLNGNPVNENKDNLNKNFFERFERILKKNSYFCIIFKTQNSYLKNKLLLFLLDLFLFLFRRDLLDLYYYLAQLAYSLYFLIVVKICKFDLIRFNVTDCL